MKSKFLHFYLFSACLEALSPVSNNISGFSFRPAYIPCMSLRLLLWGVSDYDWKIAVVCYDLLHLIRCVMCSPPFTSVVTIFFVHKNGDHGRKRWTIPLFYLLPFYYHIHSNKCPGCLDRLFWVGVYLFHYLLQGSTKNIWFWPISS